MLGLALLNSENWMLMASRFSVELITLAFFFFQSFFVLTLQSSPTTSFGSAFIAKNIKGNGID